jgi:predicted acyltransferase
MDQPKRMISLDVFRGLTIAAMILVNDPGMWDKVYAPFRHAAWNGCTFTDWIFPFFLWIVGVSMTISFARRIQRGVGKGTLILHLVKRSMLLFVLGVFLSNIPFGLFGGSAFSWATLRIPGVLQRIGVCCLFAGLIVLYTKNSGLWIWIGALLAGYAAAMKFIPVPGFGAGVLEPMGNLAGYIDSRLLAGHTWMWAPAKGFDPEGILSTIPAIATTLLGVVYGNSLRMNRSHEEKTARMAVSGIVLLALGTIIGVWFPLNKNLWSPSYTLYTAGMAAMVFAVLYWIIEVRGRTGWGKPFVVLGSNAITVYAFADLLSVVLWNIPGGSVNGNAVSLHDSLFQKAFLSWLNPINASLAFAVAFVLVSLGFAWILYWRKWFIKL